MSVFHNCVDFKMKRFIIWVLGRIFKWIGQFLNSFKIYFPIWQESSDPYIWSKFDVYLVNPVITLFLLFLAKKESKNWDKMIGIQRYLEKCWKINALLNIHSKRWMLKAPRLFHGPTFIGIPSCGSIIGFTSFIWWNRWHI